MRRRGMGRCVCGLGFALSISQPLAAQFGDLPSGYVNRHVLAGVRAEITVGFLIDSAAVTAFVPAGLHVVTLQHIAERNTTTARYLASRPDRRTAVPSRIFFAALDSLQIDDQPPAPSVVASWWLPVRSAQSVDERARGDSHVEVAYWSPDTSVIRQLQETWPPAQPAAVEINPAADGSWIVALDLLNGTIRGRCTPTGDREPAGYPLPAYTTAWSAGSRPEAFMVFTYYGHHSRECVGDWSTTGEGILIDAFESSLRDPSPWMVTFVEDGWRARVGLYRR